MKLEHLSGFDEELADLLLVKPTELLDQFSLAALDVAQQEGVKMEDPDEWIQITLEADSQQALPIRSLVVIGLVMEMLKM